ncbi:MAG TPA: bifunctional phosphoribosylaminoimidazolecarboxamide formyltransferase/IMP cyclohydrolase [bacterium]|nr:bifunctional phosphoribosylaminoimidazolecarboxamide formyltransferase/IMP cyclohydrolase [bacterium]
MKKRALISLFRKEGVAELANSLVTHDYEILSTGGTARQLIAAGIPVTEVADATGSPEYPEGLVKTLHPKIHFALLADRDNPEHVQRLEADGIIPIDIVVCNLYAFCEVADKEGVTEAELRHLIDIGGPTMIRAGAKNWKHVTAIVDPQDYPELISELDAHSGVTSKEFRTRMAIKAFDHTADYDAMIHVSLEKQLQQKRVLRQKFVNGAALRYGENPHQSAEVYTDELYTNPSLVTAKQLWGKELSFNNYVDGDGALEAVLEFDSCAVSVVKHTNPCGLATGATPREALERAWAGDQVSAYGSVIACNRQVDVIFMEFLTGKFVEMLIAPSFAPDVLEWVSTNNKKNLRLLEVGGGAALKLERGRKVCKYIHGGVLRQDEDDGVYEKWECVTEAQFPKQLDATARFSFQAIKYVKSNEIVIAREYADGSFQILAIGAGQPNRVDAIRKLAVPKARENLEMEYKALDIRHQTLEEYIQDQLGKCVLASGAFFPFRDSIEEIQAAGLRYVVQPSGSVKDAEVIAACDELGIAMVFTGMRHFRH